VRARLIRLAAAGGLLLALGLCYAASIHITGWAVPCLFRQVTGLKCPGCGVTTMCLALLRLDIAAAWQANPGLLLISPLLLLVLGSLVVQYVRSGSWKTARWQNICLAVMLVWLLLYGVLRNI